MISTNAVFVAVLVCIAIIILAFVAFPFWNLIPSMVTETGTIVFKGESGCVVETTDHYLVSVDSCDGNVGDTTHVTFDSKIKQRARAFLP
ncbi:MAG TPA: hypothetical protein VLB45_04920 [Nitrosopumilaceae archaeon]|nr:hypothetical protein [Nitrosopumilaceae archaeon]